MFTLRFDMRAPAWGEASPTELYSAALEMSAWADERGCATVIVSEHHGSPDGYLPSPLVLAAAIVGRTRRLPIQVAALLLPLYDPLRLAEDMAVLDLASGGRVSYVLALGYRAEEYALFGRDLRSRGRRMDACLETLQRAWLGEPFEHEGRTVQITPRPLRPSGPTLFAGGHSAAAVRRAARFGLGLLAEGGGPELHGIYTEECRRLGREPGVCIVPPPGTATSVFVAEDPDRAWRELGPYLLHDARSYAAWMGPGHPAASRSDADSVEALRAEAGAYRILTPEEAMAHLRQHGILLLQPLCGGLPPRLAWPSLELVVERVISAASETAGDAAAERS